MERYVCIHGHFYQPPRENPWLEAVELQDSAYPYHDWNERITAECYAANAYVADPRRATAGSSEIVNNYSRISFNFGPTLLSWMEDEDPGGVPRHPRGGPGEPQGVLGPRLRAGAGLQPHDPAAGQRPGQGHAGRAGASGTFEHRFGRAPEGHVAAGDRGRTWRRSTSWPRQGIRFTILAPRQAGAGAQEGRPATGTTSAAGGSIPRSPTSSACPPGRRICVFFYDGPISQGGGLRAAARQRGVPRQPPAGRLLRRAPVAAAAGPHRHRRRDVRPSPPLRRDGAGATRCTSSKRTPRSRLTNYGEFLEKFPPTHEVRDLREQLLELRARRRALAERLRLQLGRARPGWNQEWRGPLREALDWLRDTVAPRVRSGRREDLQGPVGGARRLHRGDPRPVRRNRRRVSRESTPSAS